MSKYSNNFKLEVVKYYNKQHYGYQCTANKFNIPSLTTVKKWVKKYNEHGEKGLLKNLKSSYSGEFKQSVIEYMHKNHLSAQETAIHFNLGSVDQATRWERIYYEEGPQGLYIERETQFPVPQCPWRSFPAPGPFLPGCAGRGRSPACRSSRRAGPRSARRGLPARAGAGSS